MELQFKTRNDKQLQACEHWIDDTTEQILYGGGKGGGKSYLGCSLIFADALIYPETHYYIARGELTDLRKFTIPSIHEVFKNWGLNIDDYATFDGQYNIFNLKNGSKVFLIACKVLPSDPLFERFGSMQMTRGWIEEAGEVAESAKSNLWLATGRWKNDVYKLKKKMLITANPKKGWMKKDFIDLWKENRLPPSRKFVQSLATDNPYLPQDYLKTLSEEKDQIRRQRLWLGDWDYEEDKDSLISFDALSDAFTNTIIKDNNMYMIVDVARFGKDSTVFSFWEGLELFKIERFHKQSLEETKQKIKDYASINRIPYSNIIIDEDGIGGGLVDGLVGVRGFVANSSPLPTSTEVRSKLTKVEHELVPKTNFKNLKAQCAYKISELINEHKVHFNVPDYRELVIEELSAVLRVKDIDSDGKLQIKSKDEVKQELGKSPDVGDTIIYRAWFELRKDAINEDPNRERVITMQQNRFARNKHGMSQNSAK
jgi:phage terminase large subunit